MHRLICIRIDKMHNLIDLAIFGNYFYIVVFDFNADIETVSHSDIGSAFCLITRQLSRSHDIELENRCQSARNHSIPLPVSGCDAACCSTLSGKPAYTYALTADAEHPLPKAYGSVSHTLLDVLGEQMTHEDMENSTARGGASPRCRAAKLIGDSGHEWRSPSSSHTSSRPAERTRWPRGD